jgi:hypothetical protein
MERFCFPRAQRARTNASKHAKLDLKELTTRRAVSLLGHSLTKCAKLDNNLEKHALLIGWANITWTCLAAHTVKRRTTYNTIHREGQNQTRTNWKHVILRAQSVKTKMDFILAIVTRKRCVGS